MGHLEGDLALPDASVLSFSVGLSPTTRNHSRNARSNRSLAPLWGPRKENKHGGSGAGVSFTFDSGAWRTR